MSPRPDSGSWRVGSQTQKRMTIWRIVYQTLKIRYINPGTFSSTSYPYVKGSFFNKNREGGYSYSLYEIINSTDKFSKHTLRSRSSMSFPQTTRTPVPWVCFPHPPSSHSYSHASRSPSLQSEQSKFPKSPIPLMPLQNTFSLQVADLWYLSLKLRNSPDANFQQNIP